MGDPPFGEDPDRRNDGDGTALTTPAFPAQLRRLRRERGLSLTDLARRTHYSKGYLSKIETGTKRATVDVARLCDEVLGADGELVRLVQQAPPRDGRPDGESTARQSDATCPYRGLSAFTPQDAEWFFGRERATAALVERTFERVGSGPLMLVAPSGAGKSSLLNAGLVPALKRGDFPMPGAERWPVVLLTPTSRPLDELLERTAKAVGGELGVTVEAVRENPAALLAAVRAMADEPPPAPGDRRPPPLRPVLIVDQFEELFTLCPDHEERRAFVRVLCALATTGPGNDTTASAVVVLGVRADFTGSCLGLPELTPVLTDGLFVLAPMSVAELRESITRPAELAGVTLEPGLVPLLLRDAGLRDAGLRDAPDATLRGTAHAVGTGAAQPGGIGAAQPAGIGADETPSGALPLVSHALLATWQRRTDSALTVDGYERAGGIQGAIARTAENVFARLYPAEQRTIRRILSRLVVVADGAGATRRRTSRTALTEQLGDADGAAAALDAFVRARLITLDSDTVQITHEALLHAWPRLRDWIHADRAGLLLHQQLAHAAAEWERENRDPSALYRGTRLETVRTWADESDGWSRLGPGEEAFLRASQTEEDGRRRQAGRQIRLRQTMLATLVVLLGLAVTAGGLAYQQREGALDQERAARSQALAVRSASLAGGRPEASMLLAEEAYRADTTVEARGALLSTQAQPFSARLGGYRGPVNAVAFAPDDRTLATASSDGTVTLRGTTGDHPTLATFTVPGRVRSVAFSPDGRTVAATSTDGPVTLWDVRDRRRTAALPAGTKGDRAVAFDPRGGTLAVATADGTVELWSTGRTPRRAASLTGHKGTLNALAFAPDGTKLVSAGADRTVRLWDTDRAERLDVLEGHTDEVLGAAFSPDGRQVVSGGIDRTVRLWDVRDAEQTAVFTGGSDDINAVAYTPDGAAVIGAVGDGTTRLWDVRDGRQTAVLAGHTDYVMGVAVTSDGTRLATAGFDQSVVLWDLGGPVLTARPFTEVWQTVYSPDGKLLATADTDHTVRLWDVRSHRLLKRLTGHTETVFSVAFSPDGKTLASGSSDGTIRLWDVDRRAFLATLTGHTGEVFSVAFAPDGKTLASAGADRTVHLWDIAARRDIAVLTGHEDYANAVAFSPDGRTLASAGDDLTVRLWDVASRQALAELTGHTGAVRSVAFAPDGRTLASSGNDGAVRLWDVRERRSETTLTGHTGSARGLAFSPDGSMLASSGNDRTVRLWDMDTRQSWATLSGHTNAVWGVDFAPDGRTVASSSTDGTVRLWDLDPGARLEKICRLSAGLGPEERGALLPGLPVPSQPPCGRS
ncbi:helix-turn-helix domain-containing protein [Streptomyces sp. DSM 3412]|uniref:Helix-turn-helix domain-containing protein n=1 Tax=Streptomyces gottesmaniae TaxID=3075518 RepID=A0ABU2YS74_9ACTN|nr:helix-turn-helix domain-containing protein [Streptomyces sp. DSM 3412]MDT0566925.1 helix-turn-helix domain-containing protein [Streptomyces sp. DSM 3412]